MGLKAAYNALLKGNVDPKSIDAIFVGTETITYSVKSVSNIFAELLGISKGRFEVGNDADFIVVDLKDECRIKSDNLHFKCGWTPFEDWSAIFPTHVFIRGEKIIEDHEIQVSQGFGS